MKLLIVDDETLARERLKKLISEIDIAHSIMEAENGLLALQMVEDDPPDVILLDIRMPVMDGLEVAYHLAALDITPAIVFTTAYENHALAAFDANATDYLLKPIRKERLRQALERVRVINRSSIAYLRENDPVNNRRTHLSIGSQGKLELIPVSEITYLRAEQKYVLVGWQNREILLDEPLKSIETEFSEKFLRIHRNALVSLKHIRGLEKNSSGQYYIRLKNIDKTLVVSRRHLQSVRRKIRELG